MLLSACFLVMSHFSPVADAQIVKARLPAEQAAQEFISEMAADAMEGLPKDVATICRYMESILDDHRELREHDYVYLWASNHHSGKQRRYRALGLEFDSTYQKRFFWQIIAKEGKRWSRSGFDQVRLNNEQSYDMSKEDDEEEFLKARNRVRSFHPLYRGFASHAGRRGKGIEASYGIVVLDEWTFLSAAWKKDGILEATYDMWERGQRITISFDTKSGNRPVRVTILAALPLDLDEDEPRSKKNCDPTIHTLGAIQAN